jgi:hypothetical protein
LKTTEVKNSSYLNVDKMFMTNDSVVWWSMLSSSKNLTVGTFADTSSKARYNLGSTSSFEAGAISNSIYGVYNSSFLITCATNNRTLNVSECTYTNVSEKFTNKSLNALVSISNVNTKNT